MHSRPWRSRKGPTSDRSAFSLIELLIAVGIMALTTFLAFSFFDPSGSSKRDATNLQLEQLGQAVLLYNLNHPGQPFTGSIKSINPRTGQPGDSQNPNPWWIALGSDFHAEDLADAWGNPFDHDAARGLVFSFGPNGFDEEGTGDDLTFFYRPPSTFVKDRRPNPGSVVGSDPTSISAIWTLRGTLGLSSSSIVVDGTDVGPPNVTDLGGSYLVQADVPSLAEGTHTVRMSAEGDGDVRGRSAWQFKVDRSAPSIYAVQPTSNTVTNFRLFPTAAYYRDPSGVALFDTPQTSPVLPATPRLAITGPGINVNLSGPTAIRGLEASHGFDVDLSASSLTISTSGDGWSDGVYSITLELYDRVGNGPVSRTWGFEVLDETVPYVTVAQPEYASTHTTSADMDPDEAGVQVQVVGNSTPNAWIHFGVWHPDGGGDFVSQTAFGPTTRVQADAFGSFILPRVTIEPLDGGGLPVPQNTIQVFACDEGPAPAGTCSPMVDHILHIYDGSGSVSIEHAVATPQTTRPNKPIMFEVGANGGTPPYDVIWDFEDGYLTNGVQNTPFTTTDNPDEYHSTQHTYIETGSYSVQVKVRDARGLETARILPVYVGTEDLEPTIDLEAVPSEFAFGVPGNDSTKFNISIGGKFLGAWRLRVDSNVAAGANYQWWYSGDDNWVTPNTAGKPGRWVLAEPDEEDRTLWQLASSNNFSIEWDGKDNTDFGPCNELNENPLNNDGVIDFAGLSVEDCSFPGNRLNDPINNHHIATLEYRDAFGNSYETTAPITLYNSIPRVSSIQVFSVDDDPNSPLLFDSNFDGIPDFTRDPLVDLNIPRPTSTNPTDLWISNYPIDMHLLMPADQTGLPAHLQITTYAVDVEAAGLVKRGEVFHNWTPAEGEIYDGTDGSSGWIPHNGDGIYRRWDIEADAQNFLVFPGNVQVNNFRYPRSGGGLVPPKVIPPGNAPAGTSHAYYGAGNEIGVNLDGDGLKEIYAIFRDFGPFLSTQIGDDSLPHMQGVTWTTIILDTTPPFSAAPIEIVDVSVEGNLPGEEFVFVDLAFSVTDTLSGMLPRGKAILKIPGRPDQLVPYTSTLRVNFGRFSDLTGQGNVVLDAAFDFEDNLGNRCVSSLGPPPVSNCASPLATSSYSINLDLIQFEWTLVGSGDLRFFQRTSNPDESGTLQNVRIIENSAVDASNFDFNGTDASSSFDSNAWQTGLPPGGAVDNSVVLLDTNIDPAHFPNPADRLAVLESLRPPDLGENADASSSFVVDKDHWYLMGLERDNATGEVVCRVRSVPVAQIPDLKSSSGAQTAVFINQNTTDRRLGGTPPIANTYATFPVVAEVNRVALNNSNPPRLNRCRAILPREIANPSETSNFVPGRSRDLHTTATGEYNEDIHWDQVVDLLIATDPTDVETYPYRGIIGEFDGGTVGNLDYRVTVNNFAVRSNFRVVGTTQYADSAWDLDDPADSLPPGALGPPDRFVKVFQWNHPQVLGDPDPDSDDNSVNYGLGSNAGGAHAVHTDVYDDPETPGGDLAPPGAVGGDKFAIEFADHSNAFEFMTTGTVFAGGWVMFADGASSFSALPSAWSGANQLFSDSTVPLTNTIPLYSDAVLPNVLFPPNSGVNAAQAFHYVYDPGGGPANRLLSNTRTGPTSAFPGSETPIVTHRGQEPATLHVDWPYLTAGGGQEGTLRTAVVYKDIIGNAMGPVIVDVGIDARPPVIPELYLRGRTYVDSLPDGGTPSAGQTQNSGTFFKSRTAPNFDPLAGSVGFQAWTSDTTVDLYAHIDETHQVLMEFNKATPVGSTDIWDDVNGRPAGNFNWFNFPDPAVGGIPPYTSGTPVDEPFVFLPAASEGLNLMTLRFKDDFQNIRPVVPDGNDAGPETEAHFEVPIYRDTTPPVVDPITWFNTGTAFIADAQANLKIFSDTSPYAPGGLIYAWTNSSSPDFTVQATDPGANPDVFVGWRNGGFNYHYNEGPSPDAPASPQWPLLQSDRMPAQRPGADDTSANLADNFGLQGSYGFVAIHDNPGVQGHGPHWLTAHALDTLGNTSTGAPSTISTAVMWDVTGPVINFPAVGIEFRRIPEPIEVVTWSVTPAQTTTANRSNGPLAGGTLRAPIIASALHMDLDRVVHDTGQARIFVELWNDGACVWNCDPNGNPNTAPNPAEAVFDLRDPRHLGLGFDVIPDAEVDEIRVYAAHTGGVATVSGEVLVYGPRLAPQRVDSYSQPVAYDPTATVPASNPSHPVLGPYGSTATNVGWHNSRHVLLQWNEIDVAGVVTEAGVGVSRDHRNNGDNAAEEWETQFEVNAGGASFLSTDTAYAQYTASGPGSQPTTFRLRALDRLTNRGPVVDLLETHFDPNRPNKVTGLVVANQATYPPIVDAGGGSYITSSPFQLQFDGSSDDVSGGSPSGVELYRVFRQAEIQNGLPFQFFGQRWEDVAAVTPGVQDDSGNSYTSQVTLDPWHGGGGPPPSDVDSGLEDAEYRFHVVTRDVAKNDSTGYDLPGNVVRVLYDTTDPLIEQFALSSQDRFFRDGVAASDYSGSSETGWTSSPNITLDLRVSDLARNHPITALQTEAGSGVLGINLELSTAGSPAPLADFLDAVSITEGEADVPRADLAGFEATINWPAEAATEGLIPVNTQGLHHLTGRALDKIGLLSPGGATIGTNEQLFRFDDVPPTVNFVASDYSLDLDIHELTTPFEDDASTVALYHFDALGSPTNPIDTGSFAGVRNSPPADGGQVGLGRLVWKDGAYRITAVPTVLDGTRQIRTDGVAAGANDVPDGTVKDQFDLNTAQTVYVAFDKRQVPGQLPAWAGTWTDTGEVLGCDDSDACPLPVYQSPSTLGPGTISMNGSVGAASTAERSYAVFVSQDSATRDLPGSGPTARRVSDPTDGDFPEPDLTTGRFANGLVFTATGPANDHYVEVDHVNSINGAGSLEIWFNPSNVASGTLISKDRFDVVDPNKGDLAVTLSGGDLRVEFGAELAIGLVTNEVETLSSLGTLTAGNWYVFTLTWNGTEFLAYLYDWTDFADGAPYPTLQTHGPWSYSDGLAANPEGLTQNQDGAWVLGARGNNNGDSGAPIDAGTRFAGTIDELRFSDTVRVPNYITTGVGQPVSSIGEVFITSATRFDVTWPPITNVGVADPGFPGTGIGVSANDPGGLVPNEWRWELTTLFDQEANTPAASGDLPVGEFAGELLIYARDLLGNETTVPQSAFTLIRDLTLPDPPTSVTGTTPTSLAPCVEFTGARDTLAGGSQPGLIRGYRIYRKGSPVGDDFSTGTSTLVATTSTVSPFPSGTDSRRYTVCDDTPLPPGSDLYEYSVTTVDFAGLESAPSVPFPIRYDTVAPRHTLANWRSASPADFNLGDLRTGFQTDPDNANDNVEVAEIVAGDVDTGGGNDGPAAYTDFDDVSAITLRVFDVFPNEVDSVEIQQVYIDDVACSATPASPLWQTVDVPAVLAEPGAGAQARTFHVHPLYDSPGLTGASRVCVVFRDLTPGVDVDTTFEVRLADSSLGDQFALRWTKGLNTQLDFVAVDGPNNTGVDSAEPGSGVAGTYVTTSTGAASEPLSAASPQFFPGGTGSASLTLGPAATSDGTFFLNSQVVDIPGNKSDFSTAGSEDTIRRVRLDRTGPSLNSATFGPTVEISQAPGRITTEYLDPADYDDLPTPPGIFSTVQINVCDTPPPAVCAPKIVDEIVVTLRRTDQAIFQAWRVPQAGGLGRGLDLASGNISNNSVSGATHASTESKSFDVPSSRVMWVDRVIFKNVGDNGASGSWRIYDAALELSGQATPIQTAGDAGELEGGGVGGKVEITLPEPVLADRITWRQNYDGSTKKLRVFLHGSEGDHQVVAAPFGALVEDTETVDLGRAKAQPELTGEDVAYWDFEPSNAQDTTEDFQDPATPIHPGSYQQGVRWVGDWTEAGDDSFVTTGAVQVHAPYTGAASDDLSSNNYSGGSGWAGDWNEDGSDDGNSTSGTVRAVAPQAAIETWESNNYSGGTGWQSASWTEGGDSGGSSGGDVRIVNKPGSFSCPNASGKVLHINESDNSVRRDVDLTGFTNPVLFYDLRMETGGGKELFVQINGSTIHSETNGSYNDCDQSQSLSSYAGQSNVTLRFLSEGNWGGGEDAWIDNVRIVEQGALERCADVDHIRVGSGGRIYREIDLNAYNSPELQFNASADYDDAGDQFVVEISTNGGSSYTPLTTLLQPTGPADVTEDWSSGNYGGGTGWATGSWSENSDSGGSGGGILRVFGSGSPCGSGAYWRAGDADGTYRYISRQVDLTQFNEPHLEFRRQITNGTGDSRHYVELNDGSWNNLRTYSGNRSCALDDIDISAYNGVSNALISFDQGGGDTDVGERYFIDDIRIYDANPILTPTCDPFTIDLTSFKVGTQRARIRFRTSGTESGDIAYINDIRVVDSLPGGSCHTSNHLRIQGGGAASLTRQVDLSEFLNPRLELDWYARFDDGGDRLRVQVSQDGTTFSNLGGPRDQGNDGSCDSFSEFLPGGYAGDPSVWIRLTGEDLEAGDYAYFDDLRIYDDNSNFRPIAPVGYPNEAGLGDYKVFVYDDGSDQCVHDDDDGYTGAAIKCTNDDGNGDDVFYVSSNAEFEGLTRGTLSFWYYPTASGGGHEEFILGRNASSPNAGDWWMNHDDRAIEFYFEHNSPSMTCRIESANSVLEANRWYYIVTRWDQGSMTPDLWVNGTQITGLNSDGGDCVANGENFRWAGTKDLTFGTVHTGTGTGSNPGTASRMRGFIDEVHITRDLRSPSPPGAVCDHNLTKFEDFSNAALRTADWFMVDHLDDLDLRNPEAHWTSVSGPEITDVGPDVNDWQNTGGGGDDGYGWVNFGGDEPDRWSHANLADADRDGLWGLATDHFQWEVRRYNNCSGEDSLVTKRFRYHPITAPVINEDETFSIKIEPPVETPYFWVDIGNLAENSDLVDLEIGIHAVDLTKATSNQVLDPITISSPAFDSFVEVEFPLEDKIHVERVQFRVLDISGSHEGMTIKEVELFDGQPSVVGDGGRVIDGGGSQTTVLDDGVIANYFGPPPDSEQNRAESAGFPEADWIQFEIQKDGTTAAGVNVVYEVSVLGYVDSSGFGPFEPLPGSIPYTFPPTNTVAAQVRWQDVGVTDTGVGFDPNMPNRWQVDWEQSFPVAGTPQTHFTTRTSERVYLVENSRFKMFVAPRDELLNSGARLELFELGLDQGPPIIQSEDICVLQPDPSNTVCSGVTLSNGDATNFPPVTTNDLKITVVADDPSDMNSPFGGWDYAWSAIGTQPDGTFDVQDTETLELDLDVPSDGVWQLNYRACDTAGNCTGLRTITVTVDRTPPDIPVGDVTVNQNAPGVNDTVDFNLTDNLDPEVTVEFDADCTAGGFFASETYNISAGAGPNYVSHDLGDNVNQLGGDDQFCMFAVDRAGNRSSGIGPFNNDITNPNGVTSVSAPALYVGDATGNPTLQLTYAGGADAATAGTSGLQHYAIYTTSSAPSGPLPPAGTPVTDAGSPATFAELGDPGDGQWFYTVVPVDNVDNVNDDTASLGVNYTRVIFDNVDPVSGTPHPSLMGGSGVLVDETSTTPSKYLDAADWDATDSGEAGDDANHIWISGLVRDNGGSGGELAGFDLGDNSALVVTLSAEHASCSYSYTRNLGTAAANMVFSGASNNIEGDPTVINYKVRFPRPSSIGTPDAEGCWNEGFGGAPAAQVVYRLQVQATDQSGNTGGQSYFINVDERAPQIAGDVVRYECRTDNQNCAGSDWVNWDEVDDDGGWHVRVTPSDTADFNVEFRMTEGSLTTFQGATDNAGTWERFFTNAEIGGLETTTLQLDYRATDPGGNVTTRTNTQGTDIDFDNVRPTSTVVRASDATNPYLMCGVPVGAGNDAPEPHSFNLTLTDGSAGATAILQWTRPVAPLPVTDDFETPATPSNPASYRGGQGWTGFWVEEDESDGPTAGQTRVVNSGGGGGACLSGNRMRLERNRDAYRELDLTQFSSPELRISWDTSNLGGDDQMRLRICEDPGSNCNTIFTRNNTNEQVCRDDAFDISAYTGAAFQTGYVRFEVGNNNEFGDFFYVDNVEIVETATLTWSDTGETALANGGTFTVDAAEFGDLDSAAAGNYGFRSFATDIAGNVEDASELHEHGDHQVNWNQTVPGGSITFDESGQGNNDWVNIAQRDDDDSTGTAGWTIRGTYTNGPLTGPQVEMRIREGGSNWGPWGASFLPIGTAVASKITAESTVDSGINGNWEVVLDPALINAVSHNDLKIQVRLTNCAGDTTLADHNVKVDTIAPSINNPSGDGWGIEAPLGGSWHNASNVTIDAADSTEGFEQQYNDAVGPAWVGDWIEVSDSGGGGSGGGNIRLDNDNICDVGSKAFEIENDIGHLEHEVDLTEYLQPEISWKWQYVNDGDGEDATFTFDVSPDGGTTWVTLATKDDSNKACGYITLDLTPWRKDDLKIRYAMHQVFNNDELFVDDIRITETATSNPLALSFRPQDTGDNPSGFDGTTTQRVRLRQGSSDIAPYEDLSPKISGNGGGVVNHNYASTGRQGGVQNAYIRLQMQDLAGNTATLDSSGDENFDIDNVPPTAFFENEGSAPDEVFSMCSGDVTNYFDITIGDESDDIDTLLQKKDPSDGSFGTTISNRTGDASGFYVTGTGAGNAAHAFVNTSFDEDGLWEFRVEATDVAGNVAHSNITTTSRGVATGSFTAVNWEDDTATNDFNSGSSTIPEEWVDEQENSDGWVIDGTYTSSDDSSTVIEIRIQEADSAFGPWDGDGDEWVDITNTANSDIDAGSVGGGNFSVTINSSVLSGLNNKTDLDVDLRLTVCTVVVANSANDIKVDTTDPVLSTAANNPDIAFEGIADGSDASKDASCGVDDFNPNSGSPDLATCPYPFYDTENDTGGSELPFKGSGGADDGRYYLKEVGGDTQIGGIFYTGPTTCDNSGSCTPSDPTDPDHTDNEATDEGLAGWRRFGFDTGDNSDRQTRVKWILYDQAGNASNILDWHMKRYN